MAAYYNEIVPFAAQWLRNLIAAGHLPPGDVDERSITEVQPDDLRGYTQCHFFAGIGVWAHALRRAEWPDDRPVWTGSCPCQPFSSAGKQQQGFADERHLWPVWFGLIRECAPPTVLGEQVASALGWYDLVSADLEDAGYAVGANDLCAAGFSGAHIRQRLYFVGLHQRVDHPTSARHGGPFSGPESIARDQTRLCLSGAGSGDVGLADDDARPQGQRQPRRLDGSQGRPTAPRHGAASGVAERLALSDSGQRGRLADGARSLGDGPQTGRDEGDRGAQPGGATGGVADNRSEGRRQVGEVSSRGREGSPAQRLDQRPEHGGPERGADAPVLGRNPADWLFCRDGKWRPVEPGTFPLVDAAPQRVGRLRAYGNALDAETATNFVEAVMGSTETMELL